MAVGQRSVEWNVSCWWGFSPSSLVSIEQIRHHLASWNAPEPGGGEPSGVNAASYADGGMGQS